ncbi:MAG: hypothetical protein NTX28_07830 [Novosphingobium sp.]|nr:hypothetical protein [Novosphingobium sp.]
MITTQQSAELLAVIQAYTHAEYEAGFYNAQAYMRKEATALDKKKCLAASSAANEAHHALLEHLAGLITLEGVSP